LRGSTIAQEEVDEVIHYHVELASHEVIVAMGITVQSYLHTGNRGAFTDVTVPTVGRHRRRWP
jgi:hypothetical protein